jgi:hypothetical protein
MGDNARQQKIRRILELRMKIVDMAGYTAGVEGLMQEPEDIPDAFWERVAKQYDKMLRDEGLIDDVTDQEIAAMDDGDAWSARS